MVTKATVLLFLVLFCFPAAAKASDYVSYTLRPGDTVSHAALKLTRNANNWRKPEVVVINTKTGRPVARSRYNRLHVGWEVRIDKQLVRTEAYEPAGRTLVAVCTAYTNPDCIMRLQKINSVTRADTVLTSAVYIPREFTLKATPAPAVASAPAPTSPQVSGSSRTQAGSQPQVTTPVPTPASSSTQSATPASSDTTRRTTTSSSSSSKFVWILIAVIFAIAAVIGFIYWQRRRIALALISRKMEKMAAAIAEGFRVHFRDDPEVKIVADPEYHPNRGYFVLRLSNALGNNTGVGDTGYVRMKLEALRDRLSSHPFNFGRWHLEDNGWLVLHCHHEPNPSLARTGGV